MPDCPPCRRLPSDRPCPARTWPPTSAALGLEAEPPSVDGLRRLHRAHVERVPYETMWIHADEPWGIDPEESVGRIARDGRGGYCFHLNGALRSC